MKKANKPSEVLVRNLETSNLDRNLLQSFSLSLSFLALKTSGADCGGAHSNEGCRISFPGAKDLQYFPTRKEKRDWGITAEEEEEEEEKKPRKCSGSSREKSSSSFFLLFLFCPSNQHLTWFLHLGSLGRFSASTRKNRNRTRLSRNTNVKKYSCTIKTFIAKYTYLKRECAWLTFGEILFSHLLEGEGGETQKKDIPFHASGKVRKKTEIPFPPPPALILFCLLRFPRQSILRLSLFSQSFLPTLTWRGNGKEWA